MSGIFINYRVGETAQVARLLYERLALIFGPAQTFYASERIVPGTRFDLPILEAVRTCDVLLAVIGPHWQDAAAADGSPRLHDPDDWVRREIAEALARRIPVIPVLIDGARPPDPDRLPPDLRSLAAMHYVRLGHRTEDPGVDALVSAVRKAVPSLAAGDPPPIEGMVMAFGIKGFGQWDARRQDVARKTLHRMLTQASAQANLDPLEIRDDGDGALMVLPAETDMNRAVTHFVPCLEALLAAHNAEGARLRVRAALHTLRPSGGDHAGGRWLLDSAPLCDALDSDPGSSLAWIVSAAVYEQVRSSELPGRFTRVRVHLPEKDVDRDAYLHTGGGPAPRAAGDGTSGRHVVHVAHAKGLQIGDGNTQHNTFT
ncbi:toll/interleukin-1 receptor domain-containing protein [Actinomadura sp. KC216]|uniref:toll/interleukin-1 receptor domain-containing protein n=1 Tax=Actinomadura sp. KC216 TaxID=2530370 RepID=UPI0014051AF3|nr:toll/interleukin-1 receptor domain-containing protein [Actinomadura sp. KC216]